MKRLKMTLFGGRLKEAFGGIPNKTIAHKLDVSNPAITTYLNGRIPPPETLVKISRLTGCSIHWLVTGEGAKDVGNQIEAGLPRARSIVLHGTKGGDGKSTAATMLAIEFAKRGHRTLLVDTQQGSCTFILYTSLMREYLLADLPSHYTFSKRGLEGRLFFQTPLNGLDLCSSSERNNAILLKKRIKSFYPNLSNIWREYSFIVIDTTTGKELNMSVEFILASMTTPVYVLIPTSGQHLSLDGISLTLEELSTLQRSAKGVNLLGAFISRNERGKTVLNKAVKKLNKLLPNRVLKTSIPQDKGLCELNGDGVSSLLNSRSSGAKSYSALASEVLSLLDVNSSSTS